MPSTSTETIRASSMGKCAFACRFDIVTFQIDYRICVENSSIIRLWLPHDSRRRVRFCINSSFFVEARNGSWFNRYSQFPEHWDIQSHTHHNLLHIFGLVLDLSSRMISQIDTRGSLSAKVASAVALKTKSTWPPYQRNETHQRNRLKYTSG